jgi:streptogramin lyase
MKSSMNGRGMNNEMEQAVKRAGRLTKVWLMLAIWLVCGALAAPASAQEEPRDRPHIDITEFALDLQKGVIGPFGITRGRDGAIWFAWLVGNRVVRITDDGHLTDFVMPSDPGAPRDIASGPDQAL